MSEPILTPVGRNDSSVTADQSVGGFDWTAGLLSMATRILGPFSFLLLMGLGSTGCAPRPQADPLAQEDAAVRPQQEVDLSNIRRNPVISELPAQMLSRIDEDITSSLQEDHFLLVAQGDTAIECEDQACLQGIGEGRPLSAEDFSLIGVGSSGRRQRRPNRRQIERGENLYNLLVSRGFIGNNGRVTSQFGLRLEASDLRAPSDLNLSDSDLVEISQILAEGRRPIYYIYSPTQNGQIVSEGTGYWMTILTERPNNRSGQDFDARSNQLYFDGLLRGYLSTLNDGGLPGWRGFYDRETGRIEFRSVDERYSACDADIYIARALIRAEELVAQNHWQETPGINYGRLARDILARIKGRDILRLTNERGTERLIVAVSDQWGGPDMNGAITFNPSYGILAAIADFARYDSEDAEFWLRVRRDTFEAVVASYEFGREVFEEIEIEAIPSADGSRIRIDDRYVRLIMNRLQAIRPETLDQSEREAFANAGLEIINDRYEFCRQEVGEERGRGRRRGTGAGTGRVNRDNYTILNEDGTRDIPRETFNFVMQQIRNRHLDHFIPDQVELEIADDEAGTISARYEFEARNLDYTENYDAIRVVSEIGRDVLINNDEDDGNLAVSQKLRITLREIEFLQRFMGYRNPENVSAGRHYNIIPIVTNFIGTAAVGNRDSFDNFAEAIEAYQRQRGGVFDPIGTGRRDNVPQYYNSSLSLRILTEYQAIAEGNGAISISLPEGESLPEFERTERRGGNHLPVSRVAIALRAAGMESAHSDIGYNFDYLFRSTTLNLQLLGAIDTEATRDIVREDPLYSLAAERRFHHFGQQVRANPDNAEIRFLYAESLFGIGRYHQAADELWHIIVNMPPPRNENEELILLHSTQRLIGTLTTLNVAPGQIANMFEWLLERPESQGKTLYIRLGYVQQLNQAGRSTEAIRESVILLREFQRIEQQRQQLSPFQRVGRDMLERAEHYSGHAGENMRIPLPRQAILNLAIAETLYAIPQLYEVRQDRFGYSERVFYYQTTFDAIRRMLGEDHPLYREINPIYEQLEQRGASPSNVPPIVEQALGLVNELYPTLPADLTRSHLAYTTVRVIQAMAIHDENLLDLREGIDDWRRFYQRDENGFNVEVEGVRSIRGNLEIAGEILDIALQEELNETSDPAMIANLIRQRIGINLSLVSLVMREFPVWEGRVLDAESEVRDSLYSGTLSNDEVDQYYGGMLPPNFVELIESYYDNAEEVFRVIDTRFGRNICYDFVPGEGDRPDPASEPLLAAAHEIVNSSRAVDPRRASHVNWLLEGLNIYKNRIAKTVGPHTSSEEIGEISEEALGICNAIARTEVSNREQEALFVYTALIEAGRILYQLMDRTYGLEVRASSTPREILAGEDEALETLEPMRLRIRALFRALLDPENFELVEAEERALTEQERQLLQMIEEHQEDLLILYGTEPTYRARAYATFGNLMLWGGTNPQNFDDAQRAYGEALAIDRFNVDALVGLANCHRSRANLIDVGRIEVLESERDRAENDPRHLYYESWRLAIRSAQAVSGGEMTPDNIRKITNLIYSLTDPNNEYCRPLPMREEIRRVIESREEGLTRVEIEQILTIASRGVNLL
jgi:hypothetical protein